MKIKHALIAALAVAGATAGGLAQAHGTQVGWSVSINAPLFLPPLPRFLLPPGVTVNVAPPYDAGYGYRNGPGRYERVGVRPWDRDGDGIPNRYDHHDDRHADWHERGHDDHRGDWRDARRGDGDNGRDGHRGR